MSHPFRYISILERLSVVWFKMTISEKRIAAKYLKDYNFDPLETFVTILERHGGSMGDPEKEKI
jgi:hypothetical protein